MEITPEFGPHRWVSFLQGSAEAALTRNLLTVSVNKQLSRQSHCLWCLQFIPHSQYVSEIKKTPQNVFPLILQESNFTNFALLLIFSPSWITVLQHSNLLHRRAGRQQKYLFLPFRQCTLSLCYINSKHNFAAFRDKQVWQLWNRKSILTT